MQSASDHEAPGGPPDRACGTSSAVPHDGWRLGALVFGATQRPTPLLALYGASACRPQARAPRFERRGTCEKHDRHPTAAGRLTPNGREAFQAQAAWLQQAARVRPEDAADDAAAPALSAVHATNERS